MRAVFLSPHDESGSIHGGKIRTQELLRAFQESGLTASEIRLPQEAAEERYLPRELQGVPLIRDLALAYSSAYDTETVDRVLIAQPDLLVLEQPWLWGAAKKVLAMRPQCKLIYSSQNIEWRLKLEILRRYSPERARLAADSVRDLEQSVAAAADLVLTTSESDSAEIRDWTDSPVYTAPNGVEEGRLKPDSPHPASFPYAVVVGSSHPPNIEGCVELLGTPTLWLPPMAEIWVVGSLAAAMSVHWPEQQCSRASGGVRLLGEVSAKVLGQVLTHANCVLVPVAYGEGANLKTAEALYTGRPVVASERAMRSYERCANFPNLVVTDSPMRFKTSTINFLLFRRESRPASLGESLTWRASRDAVGVALREEGFA